MSATNLPLLDRLGIGEEFRACAGPAIKRVAVFAGKHKLHADLPRAHGDWGRALGREHLDTLLLSRARQAGAEVMQPWQVTGLQRQGSRWLAEIQCQENNQTRVLEANIVIAAHGSWDPGTLPTQPPATRPLPGDLLCFKAHFIASSLAPGLMPLLAFAGGYGGMVHCDQGRASISCCVRRDCLARLRCQPAQNAGEAVESYLREQCAGVNHALTGASRVGPWLATGPIRPGIRLHNRPGLFAVGNCAGEAHPVVAEGISMALQSAWLLAQRLEAWRQRGSQAGDLPAVQRDYAGAWRRAFEPRLQFSRLLAHWAMRPTLVAGTVPLLQRLPQLMTWAARWTGKARRVV